MLALAALIALAAPAAHATENAPPPNRPATAAAAQGPTDLKTMFTPYAHPGEGDNDGMSSDPDDCNKGCVGGAQDGG